MAENKDVSITVVRRLPRYYKFLSNLKKNGVQKISSKEIANRMGLTASQIRQDLNCFGGFGQQGYGYNVEALSNEIASILHLNQNIDAILLGVGNLGKALANYMSAQSTGVSLIGLFDKNPELVESKGLGYNIMGLTELDEFCKRHKPKIAILCIPSDAAEKTVAKLSLLGITGIWNFSSLDIQESDELKVENMHLGNSLMTLGFKVHNNCSGSEED